LFSLNNIWQNITFYFKKVNTTLRISQSFLQTYFSTIMVVYSLKMHLFTYILIFSTYRFYWTYRFNRWGLQLFYKTVIGFVRNLLQLNSSKPLTYSILNKIQSILSKIVQWSRFWSNLVSWKRKSMQTWVKIEEFKKPWSFRESRLKIIVWLKKKIWNQ
jgi:hypothetical protein